MAAEPRGPAVGNDSDNKEGKGGMIKTPISLQDLRRSLYVKASQIYLKFLDQTARAMACVG